MAWRFNENVPLRLTRREAEEVFEALRAYQGEHREAGVSSDEIDSVISRMKQHTEQKRKG